MSQGKIVHIIPVALFVLGISFLLNLPLWLAIVPAVVILLITIVNILWKKYKAMRALAAPQQAQAITSRNWLGWVKKYAVSILAVIIVGFFVASNILGSIPSAVYTFNSQEDLNKWQGGGKAQDGCLRLGAGEVVTLIGSENIEWSKIKVIPSEPGDSCGFLPKGLDGLEIITGTVSWPYYIGQAPENDYDQWQWHVGGIFSGGSLIGERTSVSIEKNGKEGPYPIGVVKHRWWEITSPRLEMDVYITDNPLQANSLVYSNNKPEITNGGISLKASEQTKIKKVEFYK